MPELRNEVPTEEELRAYLDEHWAGSAFTAPEVVRALESLSRMDGPAFPGLAYQAVLDGLLRMNGLTRAHPFWHNTNNRPTIYKLPGFCRLELGLNPLDSDALLTAAMLRVWFGSNDFGQESWTPLCQRLHCDVRCPLYAALTTRLTANYTEEQVADFVREAGCEPAAVPILRVIVAEGVEAAAAWARQILQLLEPRDP